MVGIVLQKARFFRLFSVFVGGLTFFDQRSLVKVFFCIFLEGPDPLFKGCL